VKAPAIDDGDVRIWQGDVIECLHEMPDGIAQTCVTSPPYWGLRDYGADGQIGLEATPDEYVARMVDVFREVRRVLRDDGTLWLNLGDSYAAARGGTYQPAETLAGGVSGRMANGERTNRGRGDGYQPSRDAARFGLKHKDLIGIPWRVAFALQGDGWYLRSDIIWAKPNPMPESVTDRPTKAHEYVFLLCKSARYYFDADAIREPDSGIAAGNGFAGRSEHRISGGLSVGGSTEPWQPGAGRNARSVWQITTKPYAEAHFATFPPELPERCIKAGSRVGDTVLDPFMGSGTTAWVARNLERHAIGVELNPEYVEIAARRLQQLSLLAAGSVQTTTPSTEPANPVA
jgi:DNA modification methylase